MFSRRRGNFFGRDFSDIKQLFSFFVENFHHSLTQKTKRRKAQSERKRTEKKTEKNRKEKKKNRKKKKKIRNNKHHNEVQKPKKYELFFSHAYEWSSKEEPPSLTHTPLHSPPPYQKAHPQEEKERRDQKGSRKGRNQLLSSPKLRIWRDREREGGMRKGRRKRENGDEEKRKKRKKKWGRKEEKGNLTERHPDGTLF